MKKECAIVQDLLVLYEDDVLKEESKQMIEEHIRGCEECMEVYENTGKELPSIENVPDSSEGGQEDEAVQVMKRLEKRITYKTVRNLVIAVIVAVTAVLIANNICNRVTETFWGIAGMIYGIPTKDIHVVEMYQLKNGDIYCTLESDKEIGSWMVADWLVPEGKEDENTKEAEKELRFRQPAFWEWDAAGERRSRMIFTMERQGTVQESKETITQSCAEISVYGRTKKDKLVIWKAGQKLEEAPESIEKEAIRAYVEDGRITKAVQECENMGWDDYEKVFGDIDRNWQLEENIENGVTFTGEQSSVWIQ